MQSIISKNNLIKFGSFTLVGSAFLNMYGWGGKLSFYYLLVFILIIFSIYKYGYKFSEPIWLTIYFFYHIIINIFTSNNILNISFIGIIFQFLIFTTFLRNTNLSTILKFYKLFVLISIILFFIQEISYYLTGYRISGIFTFLPFSLYDIDSSSFAQENSVSERSASIFNEPAVYAQFLIPLFSYMVFSYNEKRRIIWIISIGIVILLLRSGNGYLGIFPIIIIYISQILIRQNFRKKIIGITFLSLAVITVGYYIKTENGEKILERSEKIDSQEISTASSFIRIFRGYYVFKSLNPIEKIFGQDNNTIILSRIKYSEVGGLSDFGDELYFNLIQNLLIRTGFVGLAIFFIFLYSLWRDVDITGKSIIASFIVLSFMAAIYFSPIMYLYLILICKLRQKSNI